MTEQRTASTVHSVDNELFHWHCSMTAIDWCLPSSSKAKSISGGGLVEHNNARNGQWPCSSECACLPHKACVDNCHLRVLKEIKDGLIPHV